MTLILFASDSYADYGACCIEDFKYYCEEELTQEECEWNFGGTFLGPDSTCAIEGDYCQSDVGACCIDFYDCYDSMPDNECYSIGGEFYGDGTTCNEDAPSCTVYYGACCYGDYCEEFDKHILQHQSIRHMMQKPKMNSRH